MPKNATKSQPATVAGSSKYLKEIRILPKIPVAVNIRTINPQIIKMKAIEDFKPVTLSSTNITQILTCFICFKQFVSDLYLQKHLREHLSCNICQQQFNTTAELEQHNVRCYCSKAKTCKTCNKTFSSVGTLEQHKLTHRGIGNVKSSTQAINNKEIGKQWTHTVVSTHTEIIEHIETPAMKTVNSLSGPFVNLNYALNYQDPKASQTNYVFENANDEEFLETENYIIMQEVTDEEEDDGREEVTEAMEREEATEREQDGQEMLEEDEELPEEVKENVEELTENVELEVEEAMADAETARDGSEAEHQNDTTVHYFVVDDENADNLVEITAEQAQLLASGGTVQPAGSSAEGLLSERSLVLETLEEPAGPHRCGVCGAVLTRRFNLLRHLAGAHEMYTLRCRHCDLKFNNPALYEVHKMQCTSGKQKTENVKVKPRLPECPICYLKFARKQPMLEHVGAAHGAQARVDVQLEQYHCKICDKRLKTRAGFSYHMRTHNGYPRFSCAHCGRRFTARAALRHHVAGRHTDRRPHLCQQCGRGFVSTEHLRKHLRLTHGGRRDHLCAQCGRTFQQASHARQHRWLHTGVRPHACSYCAARYSSTGALKKHVLRLHGEQYARALAEREEGWRRRELEELAGGAARAHLLGEEEEQFLEGEDLELA